MKFQSMKLNPLFIAVGMSSLLITGTAFGQAVTVKTQATITGLKPYIPYAHVKSTKGTLEVGTILSFADAKTETSGYIFKKDWNPVADEADLALKAATNAAPDGQASGLNGVGGSFYFVDRDGDRETRTDRKNNNLSTIEWYRIPEAKGKELGDISMSQFIAGKDQWELITTAETYTVSLGDIGYQIAAVITPMTQEGNPDRNSGLFISNVLNYSGQVIDPEDPDGGVNPEVTLPGGPNPEITPPVDGGTGVVPKTGADLRLVIHTDKEYHDAYQAYIATPGSAAPNLIIDPKAIFADSVDPTAVQGSKLKTDTIYYATVLTTDVENSTDINDYTTDVTKEYASTLVWSYVDSDGSTSFAIDNDESFAFRTLRDSNVPGSKGDINGSGTGTNDGSVMDRVIDKEAILAAMNLTPGADALGLNEQGFAISISVDDGE